MFLLVSKLKKDRNAIERFAQSGPNKFNKNSESYNKGGLTEFHSHSTLMNMSKIIPVRNKMFSRVVDQNAKKATKVPHAPG